MIVANCSQNKQASCSYFSSKAPNCRFDVTMFNCLRDDFQEEISLSKTPGFVGRGNALECVRKNMCNALDDCLLHGVFFLGKLLHFGLIQKEMRLVRRDQTAVMISFGRGHSAPTHLRPTP